MASVSSLRRWLRRTPQPRKLKVDGRKVDVPSGVNCWAVLEETVLSMDPRRIEALDSGGVVLRATTLGADDAESASTDVDAKKSDADTELTVLARIISDAHDAGAARHADAYTLAFNKFAELVNILSVRLGGLENAWQKAMAQTAQAEAEKIVAQQLANAGEGADPVAPALLAMLAQAQAVNAAKANGAANGAAKKGKAS
jgi:hypothetical protein